MIDKELELKPLPLLLVLPLDRVLVTLLLLPDLAKPAGFAGTFGRTGDCPEAGEALRL